MRSSLLELASGKLVSATLESDLTLLHLRTAERQWNRERVRIRSLVLREQWPESLHWDWSTKAKDLGQTNSLGALGYRRLFGIKAQSSWQGILLARSLGFESRNEPAGRAIIYVEYVESAPWNWSLPTIDQKQRFKGVGRQLLEMALLWSHEEGFGGRVGLHSLPQAENFYRGCGMIDHGTDEAFDRLRYFEFDEASADRFLMRGQ